MGEDRRPINRAGMEALGVDPARISSASLAAANLMLFGMQHYRDDVVLALQANFDSADVVSGAFLVQQHIFPDGYIRKNYERLGAKYLLMAKKPPEYVAAAVNRTLEWVDQYIREGGDLLGVNAEISGRAKNGKKPTFTTQQNVEYVAMLIKGEPPDGVRWKGRHIAEALKQHLGLDTVGEKRGIELLNLAQRFNRNSSG